jgi:malonyl-CoA O-methyltransferase
VSVGIEVALPEPRAARRAFDRAAASFDSASFVHDETRGRLLERLELIRLEPRVAVDLGCATGQSAAALAARFPRAHVLALDSSRRMLSAAGMRCAGACTGIAADAMRLPLRDGAVDLLFANLVLPWTRPDVALGEAARVLTAGGVFMFATLGPDTLGEVRRAFAAVDTKLHVHAAFDLHDLGDLCMAAGLAEPVLDVDRLRVTYGSVTNLLRDLRSVGAVSLAGGRRRTFTGARRWRAFEAALARDVDGRFEVTVELILGQAWGQGPPRSRRSASGEVTVPLESVRRPAGSR